VVLHRDFTLVDELWADDFIVNNPFNTVSFGPRRRVRTAVVIYVSFERVRKSWRCAATWSS
jgi:hypothetical protein